MTKTDLVREQHVSDNLREALELLIRLADDYKLVAGDDRCECDEEGDGPCVWCRMRETIEKLYSE